MKQRTLEWLNWRSEGIGSSDAPVVMGLSPYKNIYDLWVEKTFGEDTATPNEHINRGIRLEDSARLAAEVYSGIKFNPAEMEHAEYPHIRASLDGLSSCGRVLVEIKCPTRKNFGIIRDTRKVSDLYNCQIQHQLLVSGADYGIFFAYVDDEQGVDYEAIRVERNDEFIEKMIDAHNSFWECVQNRTPPCEPPAKPFEAEINDPAWEEVSRKYIEASKQIQSLESNRKLYKSILVDMCNGVNTRGHGISISFQKKRMLNREALEEKLGDLRAYEREGEFYSTIKINEKL
jgi:putative phage-type endonuclease